MTDTPANPNARSIESQPSETALSTAFMRALAAHDPREEIRGADDLAELFLTEDRTVPVKDSRARQWVMQNKIAPGMYEFMIARTAFFDGKVTQGLQQGIPQIVFLGAGYDSRPYRLRNLIRETRLYELDAQPTQERKREVLERAHIAIPDHVTLVPINFNTEALDAVLAAAGFDRTLKTLYVWEGVTYYLTAQVIDNTLSCIRQISPAGSSICFDYAALSSQALAEDGVHRVRGILKSDHAGEPTRFGIPAGTIESFLAARGYALLEHIGPEEMGKRYLTLRDGTPAGKLPGLFCLVHAAVGG